MGEGGTNGSYPCIVNAVAAAVPEINDRLTTTPVTPLRLVSWLADTQV